MWLHVMSITFADAIGAGIRYNMPMSQDYWAWVASGGQTFNDYCFQPDLLLHVHDCSSFVNPLGPHQVHAVYHRIHARQVRTCPWI